MSPTPTLHILEGGPEWGCCYLKTERRHACVWQTSDKWPADHIPAFLGPVQTHWVCLPKAAPAPADSSGPRQGESHFWPRAKSQLCSGLLLPAPRNTHILYFQQEVAGHRPSSWGSSDPGPSAPPGDLGNSISTSSYQEERRRNSWVPWDMKMCRFIFKLLFFWASMVEGMSYFSLSSSSEKTQSHSTVQSFHWLLGTLQNLSKPQWDLHRQKDTHKWSRLQRAKWRTKGHHE